MNGRSGMNPSCCFAAIGSVGDVDARRSRTCPAVGRRMPAIMRSVVVLPAPFGPEETEQLAARHVRGRSRDRGEAAVALGERTQLDHGRHRRQHVDASSVPISRSSSACRASPPIVNRRCEASAGNWPNVGSTATQRSRPDLRPRVVVEPARRRAASPAATRAGNPERARERDVEHACARCSRPGAASSTWTALGTLSVMSFCNES